MRSLMSLPWRVFRSRRAATAVEYGFILALIVLALMAALGELAGATTGMWNNVSGAVANAR